MRGEGAETSMSIRDGGDDEPGIGDRSPRARRGDEAIDGRESEGGGLTARWRARLRLQHDQRTGVKDRRERSRAEHTDRRLAG